MKKVVTILACCSALIACTQKETVTSRSPEEEKIAEYALPLDTAIAYTKRYNEIAQAVLKDSTPIRAYTVRAADLIEAMGMPLRYADSAKYDHVRVYIGMDSDNKFRLLLTPVDGADINKEIAGDDIILDGLFTSGERGGAADPVQGKYVMDFTGPCPNSCPTNSPLN